MNLHSLASILQTTDPLFPIGSYAHSYGLEELVANGSVFDADTLLAYLQNTVALNLQEFELPYLRFAYNALLVQDCEQLCELDEEIGAAKLSHELRQASASQGRQRLRLIRKLRPSNRFATLESLAQAKQLVPHHLVIFAAENVDLETPIEAALATWAYQTLAAPCAAALKLIRIGQEGAQSVLTQSLHDLETIVQASLSIDHSHAGAFIPALDIAAHRHERAHARLFIS